MVFRHFLVSGLVQGVSFRAYTQRMGLDLGLVGKVRNLADGRVEVVAAGAEESLTRFVGLLKVGPRRARVDALTVKEVAGVGDFEGFSIVEDGDQPWFELSQP